MTLRMARILKWLEANPGWHTTREIGVQALHLDRTGRWGDTAIVGHLKKLCMMRKVELGRGKIKGALEAWRIKEE